MFFHDYNLVLGLKCIQYKSVVLFSTLCSHPLFMEHCWQVSEATAYHVRFVTTTNFFCSSICASPWERVSCHMLACDNSEVGAEKAPSGKVFHGRGPCRWLKASAKFCFQSSASCGKSLQMHREKLDGNRKESSYTNALS